MQAMEFVYTFTANIWSVYYEAAPYLLIGFASAGILHQFMPSSFIQSIYMAPASIQFSRRRLSAPPFLYAAAALFQLACHYERKDSGAARQLLS